MIKHLSRRSIWNGFLAVLLVSMQWIPTINNMHKNTMVSNSQTGSSGHFAKAVTILRSPLAVQLIMAQNREAQDAC